MGNQLKRKYLMSLYYKSRYNSQKTFSKSQGNTFMTNIFEYFMN